MSNRKKISIGQIEALGSEGEVLKIVGGELAWGTGGSGGIGETYPDINTAVTGLLANQVNQKDKTIYEVTDASSDATVDAGIAWYKYKGVANGLISDYTKVSEAEAFTENDLAAYIASNDAAVALKVDKITGTSTVTHTIDGDPRVIDFAGIDYFTLVLDNNIGALSFTNLPLRRSVYLRLEQNVSVGYSISSVTGLNNDDSVFPDYSTVADENSLWEITLVSTGNIKIEGQGNIV